VRGIIQVTRTVCAAAQAAAQAAVQTVYLAVSREKSHRDQYLCGGCLSRSHGNDQAPRGSFRIGREFVRVGDSATACQPGRMPHHKKDSAVPLAGLKPEAHQHEGVGRIQDLQNDAVTKSTTSKIAPTAIQ